MLCFHILVSCTDLFARESACEALSGSRHRRDTGELDSQTFVLGGETSTSCINRPFCNGPLTPGTEYAIKLRGYTASGQYQETAYSDKVKTSMSNRYIDIFLYWPINKEQYTYFQIQ